MLVNGDQASSRKEYGGNACLQGSFHEIVYSQIKATTK